MTQRDSSCQPRRHVCTPRSAQSTAGRASAARNGAIQSTTTALAAADPRAAVPPPTGRRRTCGSGREAGGRPARRAVWRGEEGATFVEVLAALAVLSVLATVLWFASGSALGALQAAVERRRRAVTALSLREAVVGYAARIRPSYWIDPNVADSLVESEDGFRIFNLDGDPARWLELSIDRNDVVSIATSEGERHVFPRLSVASIEAIESQGIPFGLSIELSGSGTQPVGSFSISAPFGATPVPRSGGGEER